MGNLTPVDPAKAEGKTKTLLDAVNAKYGKVPNLAKVIANSPAALEGYLGLAGAMAGTKLDAQTRERIALLTAETNGCEYCLSAHSAIGKGAGLSDAEIAAARDGGSSDPRIAELLRFVNKVLARRGQVAPEDVAKVKAAGFSEGEIVEAVVVTSQNILTNYMNNIAKVALDFPAVKLKQAAA